MAVWSVYVKTMYPRIGPDSESLVKLLLKSKPVSTVNWQDYEGRMPIHLAVIHTSLGIFYQKNVH